MKVSIVVISKDEPALARDAGLVRARCSTGRSTRSWSSTRPEVASTSSATAHAVGEVGPVHFAPRTPASRSPSSATSASPAAIGDVIVFTDCGCVPEPEWLPRLLAPILDGREQVTCGRTGSRGRSVYDGIPAGVPSRGRAGPTPEHVDECPTINMAFRREVFERVGGLRRVVPVRVRHRLQLAAHARRDADPLRARSRRRARLG